MVAQTNTLSVVTVPTVMWTHVLLRMKSNSRLKTFIKFKKKSGDFYLSPDQINLFFYYLVEQAHSVLIEGGGS
tara:strand:+ start:325 stop:543 length:219 start_codon:yes stop_codon:yes gene_type:complete